MLDSKKCWTGIEDYATPGWLKEGVFSGWFDPCPLHGILNGEKIDGLTIKWPGKRIFINPPYSNPRPWVERAISEARSGKTVVMLLKHDSSTRWFARLHEAGAVFLTFVGRISFNNLDLAPFPSVLVILSRELCSSEAGNPPAIRQAEGAEWAAGGKDNAYGMLSLSKHHVRPRLPSARSQGRPLENRLDLVWWVA